MAIDVYKEWLGIPEGERPPDHYTLLRLVRFEDDVDKIRQHYKKLNAHVRKYATGQYMAESQELLNELAKAMLCLTDPERKREYDESLGREFEDEAGPGRKPLEKVLVEQEHMTRDQAKEAKQFAEVRGLSMRDAVVQMKLVDAETATKALAQEKGLSYIDLEEIVPDDSVLDRVPRQLVKRNSVLPLFVDDDRLMVACADEPDPDLEEELRLRCGVPMRSVLATPRAINQGIAKYYAAGMRDEAAAQQSDGSGAKQAGKKAAPRTKKAFSQLSQEEQRERKQYGILAMCWSVILSVLIDQFVLPEWLTWGPSIFPMFLMPVVPLVTIWYVLKVYWK